MHVKNRLLNYVGEGEGGMIWQNSISKTDNQYKFDAWGRARKLMFWDNPEGLGGKGVEKRIQDGGIHVHLWLIHVDLWQKQLQYCKLLASN